MSERDQVGAALSEAQATCSHHTLPGRILPHEWPPRHLQNIQARQGFVITQEHKF